MSEKTVNNKQSKKKVQTIEEQRKNYSYGERRKEIGNMISKVGFWGLPTYETLAEMYGVHLNTIYTDIKRLKENWSKEDISEARIEILSAVKQALAEMRKELYNKEGSKGRGRGNNRVGAAKAIGRLSEQYTALLESYGVKEKVADRLEIAEGYTDLKSEIKAVLGSKDEEDTT